MQTLEQIGTTIYEFLLSFGEFVISLMTDLVNLVELLGTTVSSIPFYLNAFLPEQAVILIVGLLTLCITLRVLGRD